MNTYRFEFKMLQPMEIQVGAETLEEARAIAEKEWMWGVDSDDAYPTEWKVMEQATGGQDD